MNVFTHLGISMKLKHAIEMNTHVKLRTVSFLLGSIKPDILPQYPCIPHFKKDSEAFIRKEIRSMLEEEIYKHKKCPQQFSERLGIITHYLSDFFCHAHSDYFKGDMRAHYMYEMQLAFYAILHSKQITRSGCEGELPIHYNATSIGRHIDALHVKYLCACRKANPFMDMVFALQVCTSVCLSILGVCMDNGRESLSGTAQEVLL